MSAASGYNRGPSYDAMADRETAPNRDAIRTGMDGSPAYLDSLIDWAVIGLAPYDHILSDDKIPTPGIDRVYGFSYPVRVVARTFLATAALAGNVRAEEGCAHVNNAEAAHRSKSYDRLNGPVDAIAIHAAKGLASFAAVGALTKAVLRSRKG